MISKSKIQNKVYLEKSSFLFPRHCFHPSPKVTIFIIFPVFVFNISNTKICSYSLVFYKRPLQPCFFICLMYANSSSFGLMCFDMSQLGVSSASLEKIHVCVFRDDSLLERYLIGDSFMWFKIQKCNRVYFANFNSHFLN